MEKLFVYESGKRRSAIKRKCENCGNDFLLAQTRLKRKNRGKYCSPECRAESSKKGIEVECGQCKSKFEKKPSSLKNSKSGYFFCSRKCKDEAQRIGGIEEIMPPHYGTACEVNYREMFDEFFCERCGYDEFDCAVDIHHIDKNRQNNKKENLIRLCSCCHRSLHFGRWTLTEQLNGHACPKAARGTCNASE